MLWDRTTGVPIAPAIVWQDRRTAGECAALREQGHEERVRAKTGLVLDPYFSATKIAWLLDHVPGARARADRGELAFGTVDSWLIWNLTGGTVHVTDVSNASRTLLVDLATLQWDDELLALFRVPRKLLPRITSSSEVVGQSRSELFGASMAIAGNAGDQQAATFGQACFAPGMAKNTYGTGAFMLMNVGASPQHSENRLLATAGWRIAGDAAAYMLEGSVFVAGAVVQWLRDGLGIIERSEHVEALARQAADNGGVFLVPAFVGLGAPHWDPDARGLMIGVTRGTTRAHLARAALESIAFQSTDVLHAMQTRCAPADQRTACRWRRGTQRSADAVPGRHHGRAGRAAGDHRDHRARRGLSRRPRHAECGRRPTSSPSLWRVDRRFDPLMGDDERDALLAQWRRAVERSRQWIE